MALGFETAVFCAFLLAAAALELVHRPGSLMSVVVTAGAVSLVAHAWQLLLPAVFAAALVAGGLYLRGSAAPTRVGWITLIALVAGWISWPSMYALTNRVGVQAASLPGPVPPLDAWLGLSLIATLLVGGALRGAPFRTIVIMVVGTAAAALLVSVRVGVPVSQYYPNKMLWQATMLGLPFVALLGARLLHRLMRHLGRLGAALALMTAGAFTAISAAYPAMAVLGVWSTVNGEQVLNAITTPRAAEAGLVWTDTDRHDDVIARLLLDFYRIGGDVERSPAPRLDIDQECALLRAAALPTVLSTQSVQEVRARYTCVSDLRVIPVRHD
jgi:hypothetical protein